jgi:hypothetical protein
MKEHNRKTLIEALSSMQEHEPPDEIWAKIQEEVSNDGFTAGSNLKLLPEYDPPDYVWNRITMTLDKSRHRIIILKRLTATAAAILLISTIWFVWRQNTNDGSDYTLSYSEETVNDALLNQNWNEDESAFHQFAKLCSSRNAICSRPEFLELKAELDELTDAKNTLVNILGKYGGNVKIITQLKNIELERTDILKKLMVMLI